MVNHKTNNVKLTREMMDLPTLSLNNNLTLDFKRPNTLDIFDRPVIYGGENLELPKTLQPSHRMDEMRIGTAMKNVPQPRYIKSVAELEKQRLKEYGQKVDIQPKKILDRMRAKVYKVPALDADGNIRRDPTSRRIIMRYITFDEMMTDTNQLRLRVNTLLNELTGSPAADRENRGQSIIDPRHLSTELAAIRAMLSQLVHTKDMPTGEYSKIQQTIDLKDTRMSKRDELYAEGQLMIPFEDLVISDTDAGESNPNTEYAMRALAREIGNPNVNIYKVMGMLVTFIRENAEPDEKIDLRYAIKRFLIETKEVMPTLMDPGEAPEREEFKSAEEETDVPMAAMRGEEPAIASDISETMIRVIGFRPGPGEIVGATWYDAGAPRGGRKALASAIDELSNPDHNVSYLSFRKAEGGKKGGRPSDSPALATFWRLIKANKAHIRVNNATDDYELIRKPEPDFTDI